MTFLTPIPSTRVSDMLANSLLTQQLQSNQQTMLQLERSISSGQRISQGSQDPTAAAEAVELQKQLDNKAQFKTNLQVNQSYLSTTDTALSTITNLLNQAGGLAVSSSGNTLTNSQLQANAVQIDSILQQVVDTANSQFDGRYVFAGSSTGVQPFTLNGSFVTYTGNVTQLQSFSDSNSPFATNISGNEAFGAISQQIQGTTDLNPTVTADTPLSQLNGGLGVQLGSIQVSDGTHLRTIDLSKAATLGDVKSLLEAQPAGGTQPPALNVQITNNGLQVSLVGSGTLQINDIGNGVTASELGILAPNNSSATIAGSDLNPLLTVTTPLANILGTHAQAKIYSPGANSSFDIKAVQNGAATNGYTLQFIDDGTVGAGSETVNISGSTITVDIDSGHSTAAQVVQALNNNSTFSSLFHASLDSEDSDGSGLVSQAATATTAGGGGAAFDQASGLQITNGGQNYTIDFSSAKTVGDLVNLINGSGASVRASINSSGTGININSLLSGSDFSIGENGGSTATELGVRTFSRQTQLADLNHGLGVQTLAQQNAAGNDFDIQLEDGAVLQFRLDGQSTIGDVIDMINNAPGNGGKLVAQLATSGNGIELVSSAVGSSPFQVQVENNSQAAQNLGLVPSGQTTSAAAVAGSGVETIAGADVNPAETDSVFNALIRLHNALLNNDQTGISRAVSLINSATTQVNFASAEVGAREQNLDALQTQVDSQTTDLQSALSNDIDTDLPTAITNLTAQQTAFQASLQLAGQMFHLTLLNYL
ncbi:MAG TPA: flagellar hook-associated protein FlgL [Pirellulales bacterium]|jgi:flagellin-like hook-associated protein FlgL|nr:flagellar hook-associated protein FlgL [Pirellulales bacterium]